VRDGVDISAHARRKKRKLPNSYVTLDQLRSINFLTKGERITKELACVSLDSLSNYNFALFGPGNGINSIIYDVGSQEWKGQLCDEQGSINDVEWYNRGPITVGSDGTVAIWSSNGEVEYKYQASGSAVVGVDLLLVQDFIATASKEGEWSIHNLVEQKNVATFKDDAGTLSEKPL
jgi:WD40 repeat protein